MLCRISENPEARKNQAGQLTLDIVDGLSKASHVLAGDTSNRNAAVLGSVDRVLQLSVKVRIERIRATNLLSQLGHLLSSQTGVCEHANLRCDVAPVVLAAELLEVLLEGSTHGDDAVSHALDLTEPLLVEGRVVQNLRGNAGAVNGRVGVQGSDKDLDLGVDTLLLLGRLTDDGEGTDTLAVKTLPLSAINQSINHSVSAGIVPCSWRTIGQGRGGDPP